LKVKRSKNKTIIAKYRGIISLIAIVLMLNFYLFGKNIADYFFSFIKTNNTNHSQPVIEASQVKDFPASGFAPGNMGGTPDKPVSICIDGYCNIDYGEFILYGIPENFQELVRPSGASG